MEEEEETGKGCWRRRRKLGGAAGVPEPDPGTDMLAWQGWGRTDTPASTKPSPLLPVEHGPLTFFPGPLHNSPPPQPLCASAPKPDTTVAAPFVVSVLSCPR